MWYRALCGGMRIEFGVQLVLVEWEDSAQPTPAWSYLAKPGGQPTVGSLRVGRLAGPRRRRT